MRIYEPHADLLEHERISRLRLIVQKWRRFQARETSGRNLEKSGLRFR